MEEREKSSLESITENRMLLEEKAQEEWKKRGYERSLYSLDRMLDIWNKEEGQTLLNSQYTSMRGSSDEIDRAELGTTEKENNEERLRRKMELIEIQKGTDVDIRKIKQHLGSLCMDYMGHYGEKLKDGTLSVMYNKVLPSSMKLGLHWRAYIKESEVEKEVFLDALRDRHEMLSKASLREKKRKAELKQVMEIARSREPERYKRQQHETDYKQEVGVKREQRKRDSVLLKLQQRKEADALGQAEKRMLAEKKQRDRRAGILAVFKLPMEANSKVPACSNKGNDVKYNERKRVKPNQVAFQSASASTDSEGMITSLFFPTEELDDKTVTFAELAEEKLVLDSMLKKQEEVLSCSEANRQGMVFQKQMIEKQVVYLECQLSEVQQCLDRLKQSLEWPLNRVATEKEIVFLDQLESKKFTLVRRLRELKGDDFSTQPVLQQITAKLAALSEEREEKVAAHAKLLERKQLVTQDIDSRTALSSNERFALPVVIGKQLKRSKAVQCLNQQNNLNKFLLLKENSASVLQKSKAELLREADHHLQKAFRDVKCVSKKILALSQQKQSRRIDMELSKAEAARAAAELARIAARGRRRALCKGLRKFFVIGGLTRLQPRNDGHRVQSQGELDYFGNRCRKSSKRISPVTVHDQTASNVCLAPSLSLEELERSSCLVTKGQCSGVHEFPRFRLWKVTTPLLRKTEDLRLVEDYFAQQKMTFEIAIALYCGDHFSSLKAMDKVVHRFQGETGAPALHGNTTFQFVFQGKMLCYKFVLKLQVIRAAGSKSAEIDTKLQLFISRLLASLQICPGKFEAFAYPKTEHKGQQRQQVVTDVVKLQRLQRSQGFSRIERFLQDREKVDALQRGDARFFYDSSVLHAVQQRFPLTPYRKLIDDYLDQVTLKAAGEADSVLELTPSLAAMMIKDKKSGSDSSQLSRSQASEAAYHLRKAKGLNAIALLQKAKQLVGLKIEYFSQDTLRWRVCLIESFKAQKRLNKAPLILHKVGHLGAKRGTHEGSCGAEYLNLLTGFDYHVLNDRQSPEKTGAETRRQAFADRAAAKHGDMLLAAQQATLAKSNARQSFQSQYAKQVEDLEVEKASILESVPMSSSSAAKKLMKRPSLKRAVKQTGWIDYMKEGFANGTLTEDKEEIVIGDSLAKKMVIETFASDCAYRTSKRIEKQFQLRSAFLETSTRCQWLQNKKQELLLKERSIQEQDIAFHKGEANRRKRVQVLMRRFDLGADSISRARQVCAGLFQGRCEHKRVRYGGNRDESTVSCLDCRKNLVSLYKDLTQVYTVNETVGPMLHSLRQGRTGNVRAQVKEKQAERSAVLARKTVEKHLYDLIESGEEKYVPSLIGELTESVFHPTQVLCLLDQYPMYSKRGVIIVRARAERQFLDQLVALSKNLRCLQSRRQAIWGDHERLQKQQILFSSVCKGVQSRLWEVEKEFASYTQASNDQTRALLEVKQAEKLLRKACVALDTAKKEVQEKRRVITTRVAENQSNAHRCASLLHSSAALHTSHEETTEEMNQLERATRLVRQSVEDLERERYRGSLTQGDHILLCLPFRLQSSVRNYRNLWGIGKIVFVRYSLDEAETFAKVLINIDAHAHFLVWCFVPLKEIGVMQLEFLMEERAAMHVEDKRATRLKDDMMNDVRLRESNRKRAMVLEDLHARFLCVYSAQVSTEKEALEAQLLAAKAEAEGALLGKQKLRGLKAEATLFIEALNARIKEAMRSAVQRRRSSSQPTRPVPEKQYSIPDFVFDSPEFEDDFVQSRKCMIVRTEKRVFSRLVLDHLQQRVVKTVLESTRNRVKAASVRQRRAQEQSCIIEAVYSLLLELVVSHTIREYHHESAFNIERLHPHLSLNLELTSGPLNYTSCLKLHVLQAQQALQLRSKAFSSGQKLKKVNQALWQLHAMERKVHLTQTEEVELELMRAEEQHMIEFVNRELGLMLRERQTMSIEEQSMRSYLQAMRILEEQNRTRFLTTAKQVVKVPSKHEQRRLGLKAKLADRQKAQRELSLMRVEEQRSQLLRSEYIQSIQALALEEEEGGAAEEQREEGCAKVLTDEPSMKACETAELKRVSESKKRHAALVNEKVRLATHRQLLRRERTYREQVRENNQGARTLTACNSLAQRFDLALEPILMTKQRQDKLLKQGAEGLSQALERISTAQAHFDYIEKQHSKQVARRKEVDARIAELNNHFLHSHPQQFSMRHAVLFLKAYVLRSMVLALIYTAQSKSVSQQSTRKQLEIEHLVAQVSLKKQQIGKAKKKFRRQRLMGMRRSVLNQHLFPKHRKRLLAHSISKLAALARENKLYKRFYRLHLQSTVRPVVASEQAAVRVSRRGAQYQRTAIQNLTHRRFLCRHCSQWFSSSQNYRGACTTKPFQFHAIHTSSADYKAYTAGFEAKIADRKSALKNAARDATERREVHQRHRGHKLQQLRSTKAKLSQQRKLLVSHQTALLFNQDFPHK